MELYLAQVVGLAAFAVNLYACLHTEERQFKRVIIAGCLLWAVHNSMLGADMAATLSVITAFRTLLSLNAANRKHAGPLLFLYLVLALGDKQSAYDWLPVCATFVGTVALFYLQGVALRIVHCLGAPLWIVHDLHYGSLAGVLSQTTMLLLTAFTVARMLGLVAPGQRAPVEPKAT